MYCKICTFIFRFHKQNSELRFGTFVFGPVSMRLFHYMRKHELVAEFSKDPVSVILVYYYRS